MTNWIVRESSSGKIYQLTTKSSKAEDVYLLFAQVIYGQDTSDEFFDTGNVDIDIEKVVSQKAGEIVEILKQE